MTTPPNPENGAASGLRSAAVGSLSGMLAGFLFGVLAMLVQAVITHVTIASYGESRSDYGYASLAQPDVLIVFTILGSIFGVLYGAAIARLRTPGVPTALGFAVLLVLVLEPLLSSGQGGFSAHVDMTQAVTGPSGFAKGRCWRPSSSFKGWPYLCSPGSADSYRRVSRRGPMPSSLPDQGSHSCVYSFWSSPF